TSDLPLRSLSVRFTSAATSGFSLPLGQGGTSVGGAAVAGGGAPDRSSSIARVAFIVGPPSSSATWVATSAGRQRAAGRDRAGSPRSDRSPRWWERDPRGSTPAPAPP